MKLIDVMMEFAEDSEGYIIDCCCPSDYGAEFERYESGCEGKTCQECWHQEYLEDETAARN